MKNNIILQLLYLYRVFKFEQLNSIMVNCINALRKNM